MIGNDVVLDYSKGYPMPQSVVGFDQKKYERLQNRDLRRKTYLEKENEEIENFVSRIERSEDRRILHLYYIRGEKRMNQEKVAEKLGFERSSISKKIDKILDVSHNSQQSHV